MIVSICLFETNPICFSLDKTKTRSFLKNAFHNRSAKNILSAFDPLALVLRGKLETAAFVEDCIVAQFNLECV